MAADPPLDLVCLSYLADAHILRVDAYPPANHGTLVRESISSIAGDGPIAALITASLGLRVGLVTNQVGADPAGHQLTTWLTGAGIHHTIGHHPNIRTPRLTVVCDNAGTRTWFASLDTAYTHLHTASLDLLAHARLAYLDCYRVLTPVAARAVAAANGTPLLLNLGGDPLEEPVAATAAGQHIAAVQTSLDEAGAGDAETLAAGLFNRLHPDAAIVTLGRLGALARTRGGWHRAATTPATVRHTHGAGAAFSAGYAHALLNGADTDTALQAGCRTGTAHCTTPPPTPHPTAATHA